MKKIGVLFLILFMLTLTACNSAYSPKIRIPWRNEREVLTYEITVLPDSGGSTNYDFVPPYNNIDYSAKPNIALSGGFYTTTIEKTDSDRFTVWTRFEFTAYYEAAGFPSGNWDTTTVEGVEFVYFVNSIESEAVYEGNLFSKMISSKKTLSVTEVTKRKINGTPTYNQPLVLEYIIDASYNGGNYEYRFLTMGNAPYSKLNELYGFAQSGSFAGGGIDNEVLLYYIRAVEMTPDNVSSISSSVNVPDPYLGRMTSMGYSYNGTTKIAKNPAVTEFRFEGTEYNCVQITLYATGDRPGHGTQLFFALNDSFSMSIPGYPSRRQQKLVRMQQSYLQYDLIGRS